MTFSPHDQSTPDSQRFLIEVRIQVQIEFTTLLCQVDEKQVISYFFAYLFGGVFEWSEGLDCNL